MAIGTLYAEGMQRFLESLITYSRRRLTQAQRPDVDRIDHLPPALALRQRPPVPGPRSTVGTMSEVLNVLRLTMSRLGSHLCPNGHRVEPSIVTQGEEIVCPVDGVRFVHPSAESFAFNSYGACPACHGLGVRSEVDVSTLVPDPGKTIEEGAVLPWNSGGRRLSMYAAGQLGVRLDVPYRSLTEHERDIVLHGEPVRRDVTLPGRDGRTVHLSVNYDNAVAAVERSLRSDNERTRRLVQRFLITRVCSVCHGTRLRPEALTSQLGGRNIAQISALGLGELREFAAGLPAGLPAELGRMTTGLLAELDGRLTPLLDVGLSYLTLDRAGASLSTGERQRIELTSTVRASTTGMLYVLDEPSVGLHPSNVTGLRTTIAALAGNGNTVLVVEHERELIRAADWVIELGPAAGATGGTVIAQGTPGELETDPHSIIGPFLAGAAAVPPDRPARPGSGQQITMEIGDLYNLHDVTAVVPVGRLTAVAGPSGAGKTALVLDSLIPAARAMLAGSALPAHVRRLDLAGIRQVVQIDGSPIGQNARSTPATYCGAFDQIRRVFAETAYARRRRWAPGHFSFNTRAGQCPTCRGLGHVDLDVQDLPDITVGCPTCHGARFNDATLAVRVDGLTVADVLGLSVDDALERFAGRAPVAAALRPVSEVGLGYLRLGEPTPSLSGGESQRLRIATRLAQQPARRAVRLRRAFHRPAPARRGHLGWSVRPAPCGRGDDHRHRPRPGPARRGRPPDRHGPGWRPGRRAHRRGGDAGRYRPRPRQRDRAVARRAPEGCRRPARAPSRSARARPGPAGQHNRRMTPAEQVPVTAGRLRPRRSCLAVPGSRPRFLEKAQGLPADQVFLDLEDACAPLVKDSARHAIVEALNTGDWGGKIRAVRVNDWTTHWTYRDVITVVEGAGQNLDCLVLPKVQDAGQVRALDLLLTQIERTVGLQAGRIGIEAQIEDAGGLVNVEEIAASSPRLETIIFGPADFMASINMKALAVGEQPPGYPADAYHYVLMRILVAARAHGLQAIDGPYLQIRNAEGFRAATRRAAALGFDGKWVLHPDQIAAANEIFSPSQEDYDHAELILDAYRWHTSEAGDARGAAMLGDEMIDEASRKMALVIAGKGRAAGMRRTSAFEPPG